LKKIIGISLTSLLIISCGGNSVTNNSNATAPTNNGNVANAVSNTTNTANTANSVKPANTTAVKPAETGPKRIAFAKGKSEGTENVTLAVGESKKFVVGAKNGQILMIEAASQDTKISVTKGKVATNATKEEPGYYDTTLLGDGDFVFEVKNTSKTELKTSINVIISGGK
jgi:hypothetical protein